MSLVPLAILAAAAGAQAPSCPSLQGSWELVDGETVSASGATLPLGLVLGGPAGGLITYAADGWMSAHIMGRGRPAVSPTDPTRRRHPPERAAAVANSYYAYYGRYEVDCRAGVVRHFVAGALHPDEVGQVYERKVSLEGDVLTLTTPPFQFEGEQRFNRLRWRRASPPAAPESKDYKEGQR